MTLHVIKWQTHVLQKSFPLSHVCAHSHSRPYILMRDQLHLLPPPLRASALSPCTAKDRGLPCMKTYNIHNAHIVPIYVFFYPFDLCPIWQEKKKVTHDSEGWRVPPTVGSETKVNSPRPGHSIALSISRGLRGGWTEVSSCYSWQRNKTTVSPGRVRAAVKEPKMRQIVREDLGDGRKQRWRKKKWMLGTSKESRDKGRRKVGAGNSMSLREHQVAGK